MEFALCYEFCLPRCLTECFYYTVVFVQIRLYPGRGSKYYCFERKMQRKLQMEFEAFSVTPPKSSLKIHKICSFFFSSPQLMLINTPFLQIFIKWEIALVSLIFSKLNLFNSSEEMLTIFLLIFLYSSIHFAFFFIFLKSVTGCSVSA